MSVHSLYTIAIYHSFFLLLCLYNIVEGEYPKFGPFGNISHILRRLTCDWLRLANRKFKVGGAKTFYMIHCSKIIICLSLKQSYGSKVQHWKHRVTNQHSHAATLSSSFSQGELQYLTSADLLVPAGCCSMDWLHRLLSEVHIHPFI